MSMGVEKGESSSQQNVWAPQANALQQLFQQTLGMMGGQQSAGQQIGDMAGQLQPGMMGGFNALMGQATGASPAMQALLARGTGSSPHLQAGIDQMGADITQNLQRDILPGIQSAAGTAGAVGSSRHGIAQGLAIGESQNAFQRGATDMRMADFQQQQQALNQFLGAQQGAAAGMGQMGGDIMNLGMQGIQGAFLPGLLAAQIFGPAVNQTSSEQWNFGMSGGI